LDGRLLGALCSIPAVKGAEVGSAFANAAKPGSRVHDPIVLTGGDSPWVSRETNRAGGIEGGMTTGLPIIIRAAMKPIPTLTSPLGSVDLACLHPTEARYERSDITAVPAARIVGEAMAASILAAGYLDKFGGDCLDDFLESVQRYEQRLGSRGLWRRS